MPSMESGECVKVVVRVRPLSRKEIQDGHEACTIADEERGIITVSNPKGDTGDPPKSFTFDAVFRPEISQRKLYDTCSAPVVEAVLTGFNGTIFAYGQTGAGKTFTMEGVQDEPELRGIIPNAFQQIFDKVGLAEASQQFLVRASYLEIYNEEIRDLLAKDSKTKLELKENADSGVYVKDLTSFLVKSSHEIDQVMQAGKKNRSVGATLMNQGSSRSHAIFTIIVECCQSDEVRGEHITVGKLNLVDLAGSERQSKTGATGDRLKEATKINLSLSALGNVISALVDGKSTHIPYRDSKLTRLLQDSLGGNTKTVMCANCGPAGYNYDETVSTLRYANRAKNIKNKPKINEDPKDAMLREFQEEISRLKSQLAAGGACGPNSPYFNGGESDIHEGPMIVEKEVIKEIIKEKEVVVGVSSAELDKIKRDAERKKEKVREEAERKLQRVLEDKARTAEESEKHRAELKRAEQELKREKEMKKQLVAKLKGMQNKLIVGGELLSKAEKQEAELRAAQQALREKEAYERNLAQELHSRDEVKMDLAERYSSIDEEVEKKSRKLEKLVKKLTAAEKELADLSTEFQREREDMLDTIRQLAKQIKLKEHISEHFIPQDKLNALTARTVWNEESDSWILKPLQIDPSLKRRPLSVPNLRRPQTEYARSRKQYDPNPRYKDENVVVLDLETTDRMTQDYTGPDMRSNVEHLLLAPIDQDDPQCHPLAIAPSGATVVEAKKNHFPQDHDVVPSLDPRVKATRAPSRSGNASKSSSNRPHTASRSRRSSK